MARSDPHRRADGPSPSRASPSSRRAPDPVEAVGRPTAPEGSDAGEVSALAQLGRTIFFDSSLSEPAGTSCATCHDPAHGYAGTNGSKLGVAQGSRPGGHFLEAKYAVGSLPRLHPPLPLPMGGGRAAPGRGVRRILLGRSKSRRCASQHSPKQPLLNPDEMGNRDVAQIAEKIARSAYAADLVRAVGATETPEATVAALGKAVEAFLFSPEMSPFSIQGGIDDYVRGKVAFTCPLEARGLVLFKDNAKGACASCHKLNDTSPNPERSPFSDYGFEAVGVPRNRALPATPRSEVRRPWPVRARLRARTRPDDGRALVRKLPDPVAPERLDALRVHAQRRVLQLA